MLRKNTGVQQNDENLTGYGKENLDHKSKRVYASFDDGSDFSRTCKETWDAESMAKHLGDVSVDNNPVTALQVYLGSQIKL